MTSQGTPQEMNQEADSVAVMAAVADSLRYLLACLGLYGAPGAVVILISAVPRARLSDADLAAFRELADVQRGVAREFGPRCAFLDVERLLEADTSAPGSWRRRVSCDGVATEVFSSVRVEEGTADVWSVEPLPRDFPRLRSTNFDAGGVHLHPENYALVRNAIQDLIATEALLPRAGPPPAARLDSEQVAALFGPATGQSYHLFGAAPTGAPRRVESASPVLGRPGPSGTPLAPNDARRVLNRKPLT